MKITEYILEIYEPGCTEDVCIVFNSSNPFIAINVGDILNPTTWPNAESAKDVLRVVNVEHLLWEINGDIKQKILIFTEAVQNTEDLRSGKCER